jgi:hypothetical protein
MAQINKPSEYFNTKLWNGNSSTQAITGVGFQPDFVWLKQRSGTERHQLLDAIRGTNVILKSDGADASGADTDILNSFDSDGYTLGYQDQSNDTGATYVGWNWKANGAGSANTDGDINSTVSASTTSGFSIVTYTGTGANATVGHGLGFVPNVVLVKRTDATSDWRMYHSGAGSGSPATKQLFLNTTGAEDDDNAIWNDTAPTSPVFTVGTNAGSNASGGTYIAYCFAEKKGFSKFGSYVGNGNADGTFVYTGFKPAFVIHKRTDTAGYSWLIHDNKRPDYNSTDKILEADLASVEQSNYHMDLLSNGFKHRITSGSTNASGGTYIYMAFAEEPLVGTNNIPATAK